jgi:hypothetical protein
MPACRVYERGGEKRFLKLSVSLFGDEGVYKFFRIAPVPSLFIEGELSKHLGRPAPVPSIFIDGELVFDVTPSTEELRGYLDQYLGKLK